MKVAGIRARTATTASRAAYTGKAQNLSGGVATTIRANVTRETILTCAGSLWMTESPCR